VPAIKLKRKCSSGWTLSNNGTHSASAAGTITTTIYIPSYLDAVYFCICCSIQEEWWNAQVAMILYINKLDFLKSAPICWLFDLLAVFILFISMSPSFQLVRYSISQKVHLYSPISPCLVTVTSDVCVCACCSCFFIIFSLVPAADFKIEFHLIEKYPPCTTSIFFCLQFLLSIYKFLYIFRERIIIRDKTD
jgi:hypothetical protein